MKIAILGTRGVPNTYGGFEQFAEYLSVGLVQRGHSVTVYNVSFHEYNESEFKGVNICKIYSPELKIGASANFIYDYLCLKDALKKDFDIIYEAGYHSNAPSYYLLKKTSPIVITNMDGLEWRRSKWSKFTRLLIKALERLAVKKSDYLVSDNIAIQQYYKEKFNVDSFYIAYGADLVSEFEPALLFEYNLTEGEYFLLIARLEPENNIEMILDGYTKSTSSYPFVVIGNKNSKYGKFLQDKYREFNIRFIGGLYNKNTLDSLRYFSKIYFHGHMVGGTNPSLLEAMASQSIIAAHDNPFNRSVLSDDALYFSDENEVVNLITNRGNLSHDERDCIKNNNSNKIITTYSWNNIISQYESLFYTLLENKQKG